MKHNKDKQSRKHNTDNSGHKKQDKQSRKYNTYN